MKWLHPRLAPAFLTTNVQRVPRSASGHVSDLLIEQLRERSRVQIPLIQTTQEPARDTQISESQFQTFIRPMLTRGWKLWFRRRYFMLEDSKLVFRTHFAPHFGRTFSFESIESGSKFLRDVETIVDKESHEPMIMLRRGGKSITVATYTQEASGAPTTHPGSRGPGITLSDVNLAIMIEHIYPESDVQVSHHSEDIRSVAYLWGLQKKGQWITAQAATKSYVAPRKFRVLAIPSLPPSSRAWCSDDDYASLLVPLYTRGFRVFHGSRYGLETPLTKTPFLSRAFPFPTVKSAFAFAHDLLNAIRDEQECNSTDVAIENRVVFLNVFCCRPQTEEDNFMVNHIRVAIIVESLFSSQYRDHALRDFPMEIQPPQKQFRPKTIKALNNFAKSNSAPWPEDKEEGDPSS